MVVNHSILLALLAIFVTLGVQSGESQNTKKGGASSDPALPVLVDMDASHLKKRLPFSWEKDPFEKVPGFVAGRERGENLKLLAVLYSEEKGKSAAVINGQTVFENSMINGYAIRKIGPNFVVITKGESMLELQMPPI
ncbi:MAG: hypothetical protein KDD61_07290, partial [Bdellovibrionales bacterium]|nr:hypothetical protein [Bdellovibrionales bacterium]